MSAINTEMGDFNAAIVWLRNSLDKVKNELSTDRLNTLRNMLEKFRRAYEDITFISPPWLDESALLLCEKDGRKLGSLIMRLHFHSVFACRFASGWKTQAPNPVLDDIIHELENLRDACIELVDSCTVQPSSSMGSDPMDEFRPRKSRF